MAQSVFASPFPPANPYFNLVLRPDTKYFELVRGYPRNHASHKSIQFSKSKHAKYVNETYNVIYVKGRQTIDSTINLSGIDDGTFPVETFNVSNVNVRNQGNVIQYVPSSGAGASVPVNGGSNGISPNSTIPGI